VRTRRGQLSFAGVGERVERKREGNGYVVEGGERGKERTRPTLPPDSRAE
jgi:hypothetical protein